MDLLEWVIAEDPDFGSGSGLQMVPLLEESLEIDQDTHHFTHLLHHSDGDVGNQAPSSQMDNFGIEMGNGGSQGLRNPVDNYESEMKRFLCNVAVPGPDQEEASETSFAAMPNFGDMMEPRVQIEVLITEDLCMEAGLLASKMMGKVSYLNMEIARSSILPELPSSLCSTLPSSFTVETFKKEATKSVYSYMRAQNRKVAGHPQHIKERSTSWRLKNPQLFYRSEKDLEEISF
ncbi:unnamed protein product [Calypogeia fissa]